MNNKIGLGIITYNAPEKIKESAFSVAGVDELVIVNDGRPYAEDCYPENAFVIQHSENLKISHTKNDALKYLMDKGCEHIFLMEDDVIIKDIKVFKKYIEASTASGILHLNFAYQGPYNFKTETNNTTKDGLLARTFNEKNAIPDPLLLINYDKNNTIAFHRACVGAFSYFHKSVIEKSGYFDLFFQNSWEHIEHTYRTIKDGFHPPFGWFADIKDSHIYIGNIENCMEKSTIAKDPQWKNNSIKGEEYFKKKHGYGPTKIPESYENELIKSLLLIYNKRKKDHGNHFGKKEDNKKYFPETAGVLWLSNKPKANPFKEAKRFLKYLFGGLGRLLSIENKKDKAFQSNQPFI
jgi:hypothetical protein